MTLDSTEAKRNIEETIGAELASRRNPHGRRENFDFGIFLTPLIEALPGILAGILSGCGGEAVSSEAQTAMKSEERKRKLTKRLARQLRKERDKQFDRWLAEQKDIHKATQKDDELWLSEAGKAVEALIEKEEEAVSLANRLEELERIGD